MYRDDHMYDDNDYNSPKRIVVEYYLFYVAVNIRNKGLKKTIDYTFCLN